MSELTTDEWTTVFEAIDKYDKLLTGGIRVQCFRRLIWLAQALHNDRMKKVFDDLKTRHKEPWVHYNFANYLSFAAKDRQELDFVAQYLGISLRAASDYLRTLERLAVFGF